MDIAFLEKLVQSPFLWSILCIIVAVTFFKAIQMEAERLRTQSDAREQSVIKLYEDHKQESTAREERLMNHLDKTTDTLQHIEQGLNKLEGKMDGGFEKVWERIDKIEGRESL